MTPPKFATLSASGGEKYVKIHPNLTELTDRMLTVESARTRRPKTWLVMEVMRQWAEEYERMLARELEEKAEQERAEKKGKKNA